MLIVRKITDLVQQRVLNVSVKVSDLTVLADNQFIISGKSDMLLGAEIVYVLLGVGHIYSQSSKFLLQNTLFSYKTQ